jgi:hypothetical protein
MDFINGYIFFSKDKDKLVKVFCHMFNLEVIYVVAID